MISIRLKRLTFFLVLPVVSLGVMTAYIKGKSEAASTPTQAQEYVRRKAKKPFTFNRLPSQPNIVLNVNRQTGACPETARIWYFGLPFEGGGEAIVVADTWAIANTAKLVASGKLFVEYSAPLRESYASCVGSANKAAPSLLQLPVSQ